VRMSRFERRILAAIVSVALVTLSGALWFGQGAVSEAYEVGVNERVLSQLRGSLAIYRRHFIALRDDAERTAEAIAHDYRAHDALSRGDRAALARHLEAALERYPNVARIVVRVEGEELGRAERAERLDEASHRLLSLRREEGRGVFEVTIATDAQPFYDFQRAGELVEVYARLVGGATYVSSFYLGVYTSRRPPSGSVAATSA